MKDLIARLRVDPDKDLKRLLKAIDNNGVSILPTGMEKHFEIARLKPAGFRDHDTVLGISIGGSNTKVILASMKGGRLVVHHLAARANPLSKTHYADYFDTLLFQDKAIREYMNNSKDLCVGISVAVPVIDGVPFHRQKIPTIEGLIARDYERDAATHNIYENMRAYLKDRGAGARSLFCQFDSVVANYGGASLSELGADEKTMLLVCGTGLAAAIEQHTVSIGMADVFDKTIDDDTLLPFDLTEGHQYQYAIAGKGLYSLMERAVRLRAREAGSKLRSFDPAVYFKTAYDTRSVVELWESTLGHGIAGKAKEILSEAGSGVFSELQDIASAIVERAVTGLANCAAAAIHADSSAGGKPHTVFFEGSIALNENILPRIKNEIIRRIDSSPSYDELNIPRPPVPLLCKTPMPVISDNAGISERELQQVDLTVKGAVTSAIAEDILKA